MALFSEVFGKQPVVLLSQNIQLSPQYYQSQEEEKTSWPTKIKTLE